MIKKPQTLIIALLTLPAIISCKINEKSNVDNITLGDLKIIGSLKTGGVVQISSTVTGPVNTLLSYEYNFDGNIGGCSPSSGLITLDDGIGEIKCEYQVAAEPGPYGLSLIAMNGITASQKSVFFTVKEK